MIKIDDKYTLVSDSHNWILRFEEFNEVTDGKTNEVKMVKSSWESYHGELKFALRNYCNCVLKTSKNIEDIKMKLEYIEFKINSLKI